MFSRFSWIRKLLRRFTFGRARANRFIPHRRFRPVIESLESRLAPATITGTTALTYTAGTGINNNISVTIVTGNFVFTDTAETITTSVTGATGSGTNTVDIPTTGITGVTLALGTGADTISSAGVVLAAQTLAITHSGTGLTITGPLTTAATAITVTNSGTGDINISGAITSANGNVTISSTNGLNLNANLNAGTGTVSLLANQDSSGTDSFTQNATAATSTITGSAATVTVNTAGGGTGNANIRMIALTGTLTINASGGSILYAGTDTLNSSRQGTFDDASSGNTLAPTGTVNAKTYSFTVSGSGSIGTAARPIQTSCASSGAATLNAGSGGVYFVDWGNPLSLSGATATGAGNVMVVTANASGHNLTVTGAVKTATGNIFLAADDTLTISAAIGGAGFSGTVYLGANRDEGNTGTLTMTAATGSITTTNATTNAVLIEDYGGVTGTIAGVLTLGNITVGNGGTITATTVPTLGLYAPAAPTSQGEIIDGSASIVLNAGAAGTVALTAAEAGTSDTAGIGTSAIPILISAGTVTISDKTSISAATDSVFVTGNSSTAFTGTVAGTAAGTLNLNVTSGNLTISNASTAGGGAITATDTVGNITVSGPLGSAGSGAIALNAGTGNVFFTSTDTLLVNDPVTVTAGTPAELKSGASMILNAGQITSASGVQVDSGATLSGTGTVSAALIVSGILAPTASMNGLTANTLTIQSGGTLQVALNGVNPGQFSFVTITGAITLGATSTLVINSASNLTVGQTFQIINNNAGNPFVGAFGNASFTAANNPGISFTMSYTTAGNNGALTVAQVAAVDIFDVVSATGTLAAPTGVANGITVSVTGSTYTISDSGTAISLTGNATTAGWSNTNANTITGPTSSLTTLAFNTNDGVDAVTFNSTNLSATNLTISGTGSLDVDGNVTSSGTITISGFTNITDGLTGTPGTLTAGTLSLTASTGIGSSAKNLLTAGGIITAAAGSGGVFITQAGSTSVTATATGAGNISVTDTSGTLTVGGATTTATGSITLASAGGVAVNANVNAGSGVITISANTAGSGTSGYSQATAATLTTTNTTASALTINVNTAGGGTGTATLGNAGVGSGTGGFYTVNAHAGTIVWNNTPVARSGASAANVISAYGFSFSDTGTAGVGTSAVPMQISGLVENDPFSANAGSGGIFVTDFSGDDLQVNQAIATGAGNINIETSNAGGHDMLINGTVTTGTGSITLYADDDLMLNGASAPVYDVATNGTEANALIGGSGFSGTVDIEANLDAGNEQTLVMSAGSSIVTSNTSASAVLLEAFSGDGSVGAIANGGVQLTNVTVGAGGTITVVAGVGAAAGRQGNITQLAGTLLDTSGGAGTTYGSVVLTALAFDTTGDGNASAANGQGNIGVGGTVSAPTQTPIMVKAATVSATTTGTNLGNTGNINISDAVAGTFTAKTSGNAVGTITLSTTSGALTIGGASSTGGGSVTLTGAAGVALNAALGSSATGAIAINGPLTGNGNIVTGTGALTVTQNANSTYAGSISGTQNIIIAGSGALSLTGASGNSGTTQINSGQLLVDNPGSLASSTTVNATGTLGGTGAVPAVAVVGGTVNPGDPVSGPGALTLASADFSSGGDLTLNIAGFAVAGTNYDQLNLGSGLLNLGGTSKLTIDLNGLTTSGTATNVIAGTNIAGTFTTVNVVNNPNNFVPVLQYTPTGLTIVIESAPTHFQVSASPSSLTAGGTTTITVTALDAFNNLAPTYTGTVHFTSTDGQAILPANATLTNGVGTFTVTLKTAGNETVTATDTVTPSINAVTGSIIVAPAALNDFAVTNTPTTIAAGMPFSFTVTAQDQYGNTITGFGGSVNLTTTDTGTSTSVPASVSFTNGVSSPSATLTTVGSQTIFASNGTVSGASGAISVTPGAVGQFVISGTPTTATLAGTSFSFTVTTEDLYGNPVTNFTGPVHFSSTDTNTQTQLPPSSSLTNGVGTFNATLTASGSQTITVSAGTASGTSQAIAIAPAGLNHFAVTNTPISVGADTPFSFTVTAQDLYNNTVPSFAGSVAFSSTDTNGQTQLPANSSLTSGVGTFNAALATVGTQTITAIGGAATGVSSSITVTPGAVTHFEITGVPASADTAGNSFSFTVTAEDSSNNTVTGYTGPVAFSSTDTNSFTSLPGNSLLINGIGTFNADLTTAGSQTITVADASNSAVNGTSAAIPVTFAAMHGFAVTGTPATIAAGTAFPFSVKAEDLYGNTVTIFNGPAALSTTDTNAQTVLPSGATLTGGVSNSLSATLTKVGSQTITASNGTFTGTSATIAVIPAALDHFTVTGTPTGSIIAGASISFTVTALDFYGNTLTGFTGPVTFSSTDTNSQTVLPPTSSLTNGVGTFTATLTTAGSQTITVHAGSSSGTSAAIVVTPNVVHQLAINGTPTGPITAGTAFSFSVTAEDAYGNTVPTYAGTVAFGSSDTSLNTHLPASSPLTNGVGSFSATLTTAGNQTISATDAGNSSINGTSSPIAVTFAALNNFAVTGTPTSITAGAPFTFTVTALDMYGNTVGNFNSTASLSSTDTNAQTSLPNSASFTNGVSSVTAALTLAGSETIAAGASSFAGTSAAIQVTPAALDHFALTGTPTPSVIAGHSFSFTVTAQDLYGNTVPSFGGTVSFTSTDTNPLTSLPAPGALTNGIGTFSATLDQAGSQTIHASASTIAGTSNAIHVVANSLDYFAITATPTGADTAGTTFTFTVTAQDLFGNTEIGFGGSVAFGSTDTNAQTSLPAPTTLTNGVGSFSATLTKAGNQTITVSAASITGASNPIDVVAAALNHFALTGTPTAAQTAGVAFSFTVTAQDFYGNTILGYGGVIGFSSTDTNAQTSLPGSSTLTAGVGIFSATLTTAGAQTISASDGSVTGTSNSITVAASTFDHLALTGAPASITAGTPFSFNVFAQDKFNNTVPSYAGPVTFTTTDTNAATSLPSGAALTNGVGSFSATLDQAGTQTITVSNGAQTANSGAIHVTPAGLDHFVVSGTPTTPLTAGTPFTFTVTAQDAFHNVFTGYAGTVSFTSTDVNSQTSLPAPSSLTAGVGTFTATLTSAGAPTITAKDGSALGVSNTVTITPASLDHFAVTGTPGSVAAGTAFSFTVTAQDIYKNTVTGYAGMVSFSSTDHNAQTTLPTSAPLTAGVGAFSATLTLAGGQTITATDGSTTGVSAPITVTAAGLDHFAVTGTPTASIVAGTSFSFTVAAQDVYDNTFTGYAGTVSFSSTDTNAQTSLPAAHTLTSGVGTFSATLTAAGAQTITATDGSATGSSNAVNVTPAALDHFALTGTPASIIAGVSFSFTVTAQDKYKNTVPSFSGSVSFTSSDTNSATSLPASGALTNGVGGFSATLTTAGSQTISAQNGSITGVSNAIGVTPAALDHFALTGAPATITAGTSFNFTVMAQDIYKNTVVGYAGTVSFQSTDTNAQTSLPPGNSVLTDGVGTFAADLTKAGNQTITATDTAVSIAGTSGTISVKAAAASQFAVALPAISTAGNAFTFTVTAIDLYDNTVPGYSGTVHFSSSDANALTSLPGNSTLTNGFGSFSATLTKAGTQSITATDIGTPAITGSSNITIAAASATHFMIGAPTGVTAGSPFTVTVTALDTYGNTAAGYTGTVHFTSSDTGSQTSLPANTALTAGVGAFSVTLTTAGSQTLTATDTVSGGITGASSIAVTAGAATNFVVGVPVSAQAGVAFTLMVTAQDQYNNTATTYTGTVSFTSTDTNTFTALPIPSTLTAGVGSFSATLTKAGMETITASDAGASISQTSSGINVHAATLSQYFISVPATATAGGAFTFTVTAADSFGNTDTAYNGTAHFTSSDNGTGTTLPANSLFTNGVVTVSATLTNAGMQSITATDIGNSSLTGNGNVAVSAASASRFSVSAPAAATAGSAITFTVTALDPYSNIATGYTGTVSFSSSDTNTQTQLPGASSLTNGVGSFSATLTRAGTQMITATDSSIDGISGSITVAAAATTHYLVSAPVSAAAGSAFTFTVTAQDAYNNTTTGYHGTVSFSSTDTNALTSLPNPGTLTAGVGGFSATLTKSGNQTITATDSVSSAITSASNNIAVAAAAATHFVVSAPSSAVAGNSFTFTVTAQDQFANTALSYNGSVNFTSSDTNGQTTLPASATLTNGAGTFSATLTRAGNQTITAADALNSAITGVSGAINVGASVVTHFGVSTPSSATAGVAFSVSATALDAYNNTVIGYNGLVHFTSSDTNAQTALPADSSLTNGVGSFTATLTRAGAQTITATDTVSSVTGASGVTNVSAVAATHYLVSAPADATAGSSFSFTVTAQDKFGNTAVGYTGTVHFTSSDSEPTLPADSTLSNGVGSFSATLTSSGTQTITATDTTFAAITGTTGITVSAAAATHFSVSAPASATAGVSFLASVTALDPYNNTATAYSGTVHFTSSDTNTQTTLPIDTTLIAGSGSFSVTLTEAGSQTITATDTLSSAIKATSGSISVSAAAVSQFLVSAPALVTASTGFTFTVTAADSFDNTVAGYSGTVHFTSTDAQATLPANTTLTHGVGSFSATLKTTGFQSLTATDNANPALTGNSGPIGVAGLATHFNVSAPANAAAGSAFSFTVTALDGLNAIASSYTGMVHFTSSDPIAGLPGSVSLTDGVGTFTATLKTAGNQTLTAADTANSAVSGTATVDVSPLAVTRLAVNVPPSATAGTAFTATLVAQDIFNNTVTNFNDVVHFTSTDGRAVLPADTTLTNGVGSFSITLDTVGIQTLTATDTVSSSLNTTSGNVNVRAVAATHYLVSAPSSVTAGTAFTFTVTALDAFNNLVSGYAGIVNFTSSDAQGVLPGGATLTNGVGTFTAILKTAGSQTLTAADSANPSITGTADNLTVGAATVTHFAFSPLASAITGTAFDFTLTAEDSFNNAVKGYTGTVHVTSSDAQSVLPANATLTNGIGTFSATLKTTGAQTLTATDTTIPGTASTSRPITVTGAVSHFAFSPVEPVQAGGAFTFTVTAEDQFDNTVGAYNGVVGFTSGDGQASLPGAGALIDGVGNFVATLRTAGVQDLAVAEAGNGALSGFTNVTVDAGAATRFAFNTPAGATAGTSFTVMVSALDKFNNVAAGFNGTVRFSSSDNNPHTFLPANSPLTDGVGSFSVTLTQAGTQTLGVNDTGSALAASNPITVSAGAASKFLITGTPAGAIVAGTPFHFTVTALDAYNNTALGYNGTVHFTSTDTNAHTLLPADSTLSSGAGIFSAALTTAGTQSITATDLLNGAIAGASSTVNVIPAATVASLGLSAPANIKAGTAFSLTVTARDMYGNAATDYAGTIHFTSSDAQSVLPADFTFSADNGGAQSFSVTLKTTGSQTVSFVDTTSGQGASKAIVVSSTPTHFLLSAPVTATAGTPITFTVTALDAFGNPASGYTGSVHFTSSDGAANLPLNTSLTNGVGTFTAVFLTAGAETLTAADTVTPKTLVASKTITVSAGAATHFIVSGGASATAGTAFAFTLTAKDAYNNTALGYSGTVHFTSSDGAAILPANATLANGVGTFHATLKTAGAQTWTATDTVSPSIAAAVNNISVSPAVPTHFAVALPASASAGNAFSITVTAFDAFGNEATNYGGAVHLTSTDTKAVFAANNVALTKGVGTFNVTLKTAGAEKIAAAAATSAAVNGSASVSVNGAAATHLMLSVPKNAAAGTPVSLTVTAEDAYNNIAAGYAGTIQISSTDAHASLPASTVLTNGMATFSVTFGTKGNQALSASDTVTTSITGKSSAIAVTPGATTQFKVSAPAISAAGTAVKVSVIAQDGYGNTTTGYTGKVQLTSSDGAATLPAAAGLTAGVGTFSVILSTSGLQTITASDALNAAITGASNAVAVSAAAAGYTIQLVSASVTAGAMLTFTVMAVDGSGNTATGYTGTVQLTSTDPKAVFAANNVKLTKGVGTFKVTLKTAGTQSISATDSANGAITGVNSSATVYAAAASRFAWSGLPTSGVVAGTPFSFTVTALDAYGNTATNYGGTVHFTSSDTGAQTSLPADAMLTGGVGSFNATLTKAGAQTMTAVDLTTRSIMGVSGAIPVTAAAAAAFVVNAPAGAVPGKTFTVTVTATDQYGNFVTNYDGSVQLTSSDPLAVLPAAESLSAGAGTFMVSLHSGAEQTITATDASTASLTGTSEPIAIGPGKHSG